MTMTGLTAFDSTIQTTNVWLNDLMDELGWNERHRAYLALRTVLHALRDRLTVDEASDLAAQLPMLVRGFYYEGWHPSDKPLKEGSQEEFLAHVASAFDRADPHIDAEKVVRAVFQVLGRHVTEGQVEHVRRSLPESIRSLWPEHAMSQ